MIAVIILIIIYILSALFCYRQTHMAGLTKRGAISA